jgi:hypothetical protein
VSSGFVRGIAVMAGFAVAAAVNVVAGLLTDDWGLGLWIALGVLVLFGGGLQIWLSKTPSPSSVEQSMRGVRAGGSVTQSGDGVSKRMQRIRAGKDVRQKGKDSDQSMQNIRAETGDVSQELSE